MVLALTIFNVFGRLVSQIVVLWYGPKEQNRTLPDLHFAYKRLSDIVQEDHPVLMVRIPWSAASELAYAKVVLLGPQTVPGVVTAGLECRTAWMKELTA